jgi:signal transduction histidine kinase
VTRKALRGDGITAAFTASVVVSVTLLAWFGNRAIQEWRRTSVLLAERRSKEAVDLLQGALARDMSGVQQFVLTVPQWQQFASDRPHELNDVVASAFARYPYPETFFAWRAGAPSANAVLFNRSDRRPTWSQGQVSPGSFPVSIERNAPVADAILASIARDVTETRALSVFTVALNGQPYQVVAVLTYGDVYREHLSGVVGFTVNLSWVRQHYFSGLARQVWSIGPGADLTLAFNISDDQNRLVTGVRIDDNSPLTRRRTFDLAFFDPDAGTYSFNNFVPEVWTVAVSASQDPSLSRALGLANRILAVGGASSLALAVGLVLMIRAVRQRAQLSQMRSDFVSAVTHELKTPLATIKAAAETLSRDRLTGMTTKTCGHIVGMEAKRLSRLVENLLAYSRITDIADTYAFETLAVAAIFNDVQQDFESQLDQSGFELALDIAPDVTNVKGDRLALRLLFDNLVDNAIKYAGANRILVLNATRVGRDVHIDVIDSGIGIPENELPLVTRKFVRGSAAPAGGSGLGLAIATRIATDHGGRLTIRSAVGHGTTVTVVLPAAGPFENR